MLKKHSSNKFVPVIIYITAAINSQDLTFKTQKNAAWYIVAEQLK